MSDSHGSITLCFPVKSFGHFHISNFQMLLPLFLFLKPFVLQAVFELETSHLLMHMLAEHFQAVCLVLRSSPPKLLGFHGVVQASLHVLSQLLCCMQEVKKRQAVGISGLPKLQVMGHGLLDPLCISELLFVRHSHLVQIGSVLRAFHSVELHWMRAD